MKSLCKFFVAFLFITNGAYCESFLTAQSFPETFNDLSFSARNQALQDFYEPYAPDYQDGVCIKNCAFFGLTIKQEEEKDEENTQNALEYSMKFESEYVNRAQNAICKNRNESVPIGQKVPYSEPLMGRPKITSKFGPRVLDGVQSYHDGIDYRADIGTMVYAPADARVIVAKKNVGRCGNFVKLQHEDGTKTLYCHLSEILVKVGDTLEAGCAFAKTGNSGYTKGAHLHYAIQDKNGNKINPAAYTKRGF